MKKILTIAIFCFISTPALSDPIKYKCHSVDNKKLKIAITQDHWTDEISYAKATVNSVVSKVNLDSVIFTTINSSCRYAYVTGTENHHFDGELLICSNDSIGCRDSFSIYGGH